MKKTQINSKLFFNLVFFITGSAILLVMIVVVLLNFFKDARVFQKPVAAAVVDTTDTKEPLKTNPTVAAAEGEDEYGTIKYNRPPGEVVDKTDYGEEDPRTKNAEDSQKKQPIKVEVINYTGIKNLAEEIKTTLEASGYEVSAGNEKSNQPVKTIIIERNDKKAGADIQKILKIGTVTKWPNPDSKYDVTIKIGDDYKP